MLMFHMLNSINLCCIKTFFLCALSATRVWFAKPLKKFILTQIKMKFNSFQWKTCSGNDIELKNLWCENALKSINH